MENLIIEEAKESDIPSLIELYAQLDGGDKLTIKEAIKIIENIKKYPHFSLYVARLNDRVVGAFELLIMDNVAHKGAQSGIVEDVIVDSSMRSKGIGRAMMKSAMEICRKNNCYKLVLSSDMKRGEAHEFYESLGFEKHGYSYKVELKTKE